MDITIPGQGSVHGIPTEHLKEMDNGKRAFFAGRMIDPGIQLLATKMEYSFFTPGTDANRLFDMYIVMWNREPWVVVSLPMEFREKYIETAQDVGLHVTQEQPKAGETDFPVWSVNWSLISNPLSAGKSDKELIEMIRQEDEDANVIFTAHGETPICRIK